MYTAPLEKGGHATMTPLPQKRIRTAHLSLRLGRRGGLGLPLAGLLKHARLQHAAKLHGLRQHQAAVVPGVHPLLHAGTATPPRQHRQGNTDKATPTRQHRQGNTDKAQQRDRTMVTLQSLACSSGTGVQRWLGSGHLRTAPPPLPTHTHTDTNTHTL